MDKLQLGWVVGVLEGEGYIGEKGGRPVVTVVMTDEDVVRRLGEWTEVGNVTGPRPPRVGQTKPVWQWTVTRRDDAAALLELCLPWFGQRRAAVAKAALEAYTSAGLTRGTSPECGRGHDISDGSPNLRITSNGKYMSRRCLKCQARRQRDCRARAAVRKAAAAT